MDCQIKELLPEFVLGEATIDIANIESHIGACPECRAELALLQQAFSAVVDELPRVEPRASAREKIFFEVNGLRRFDPFIERVADLFDLRASAAEEYLRSLDQEDRWVPGPAEGITVFPVAAGPRLPKALTAFVRLGPKVRFPMHRHVNGEESVLLVQGSYRDDTGEIVQRGQLVKLPNNYTHTLIALDGPICIGAVVHYGHDYDNV